MKNHGIVRSTVEPKSLEVNEKKVFAATDIHPVTVNIEGQEAVEYEFNLLEYDKDEYIKLISDKNSELEENLTDTQMALCDVYELMI